MSSNICKPCHGSGNRVSFAGRLSWSTCTRCSGKGVRHAHGPAVIVIHGKPARKRRAA